MSTRIQSILFDRQLWTIRDARSWLKKNNYKYEDIDRKPKHYRFRQINPDYLKRIGYKKYRTKDLNNGVELIIAIRA